MMYTGKPVSTSALGKALDIWALNQPCPRAVRNRRTLISKYVSQAQGDGPMKITSLGCGPGSEFLDHSIPPGSTITLIDIDNDALGLAATRCDQAHLTAVALNQNILRLTRSPRDPIASNSQDLIYSLGLIDYFSDRAVVSVIDYVFDKIRPGGFLMLGNFIRGHDNENFFTHALDWKLRLRSPDDLMRLAQQSRFRDSLCKIGFEEEGVQMFIQCQK